MVFKPLDPATAARREGVLVHFDRHSITHRFRDRTITMEVEHPAPMAIYVSTMQPFPPGAEPVEAGEKAVVLSQVAEALQALGVEYELVD